MSQTLLTPDVRKTAEFESEEDRFLAAESEFLGYYASDIGSALGLGELEIAVVKDSLVLAGYRSDGSRSLFWDNGESLQAATIELS